MRRSFVGCALVMLFACIAAACSDAASAVSVDRAVAKVSTAPNPRGAVDDTVRLDGFVDSEPLGAGNVWRVDLCSDRSCPLLLRRFVRLQYQTLPAACADLSAYALQVGGSVSTACPPPVANTSTTRTDAGVYVMDEAVVVIQGGRYGDTLTYTLEYSTSLGGAALLDQPSALRLGIGEQVCSSVSNAQACVAARTTP